MKYSKLVALLLMMLVPVSQMKMVSAYSFNFNVDVFPIEGSTTSNIMVIVRAFPIDSTKLGLFITYDGYMVVYNDINNTTHVWTKNITPPTSLAKYQAYGVHNIKVWLGYPDSTWSAVDTVPYTIVSGAISGNWWTTLPQDFWAYLASKVPLGQQGPQGPQGLTGLATKWYNGDITTPASTLGVVGDYYFNNVNGDIWYKTLSTNWDLLGNIRGPQGVQGLRGYNGTRGIQSIQGIQGIQGLPGNTGTPGNTGATGATGATGVTGSAGQDANGIISYAALALGVIALVMNMGKGFKLKIPGRSDDDDNNDDGK
jgi:hypothetical protein